MLGVRLVKAQVMAAAFVLVPRPIPAQSPEYQLRLLTHAQWAPPGSSIGVGAWAVLPNVMNEADPYRALLLGGLLFRNQRRWVEVLAGALVSSTGPTAELSVRYLERLSWMSFFLEGEYNIGNRRFFIVTNATVPVGLAGVRLRAGVEGEWVHTPVSEVTVAGPRLAIALPICGRWCRDAVITTAFRFHSDGHRVLRQYVGLTF